MNDSSNTADSQSARDNDLTLLDLLIILAKHKLLILGMPLLVAVLAAGYSLTLPNIYVANTRVLPPQGQSGVSSMLSQLGGVAALAGGVAGFNLKNPNDVYVAMLRSRSVADNLNKRFDLMKRWKIDSKYPSLVYDELGKITRVSSGKDGIIVVEIENTDPKFAADLANAYVDELVRFTSVLAVTEGAQRRLFFERQFALAKQNLDNAEVAARQALQTGGLAKVDEQGRAIIEASARLRGQITVKEVQIGAMRAYAAERNPELQLAQQELDVMKHELGKIEGSGGEKRATAETNGHVSGSLSLLRDYKYRETIFELLAKQYEAAKIDEAKDSSLIQVMDKAIEPDRKSKPKRSTIVVVAAFVAFFLSILWVFVRELSARGAADPQRASRMQQFKRHLWAWK
jgi:tyrosine-protein kinase Etk/Wzc